MSLDLLKSPAGETPIVGENLNLKKAQQHLVDQMNAIERRFKEKLSLELADIHDLSGNDYRNAVRRLTAENSPGTDIEYKKLLHQKQFLFKGRIEICCPKSNFHVWGATPEGTANFWNKMVERLDTLNPCCKDELNLVPQITAEGFTIHRCRVCGRRHVPYRG